jgi:hypothetical protein
MPLIQVTFNELAEWYLGLEKVKSLSSFWLVKLTIGKFNKVFGDTIVGKIKHSDLENYQAKRLNEGKASATIDHEIGKTKSMIIKAYDDDMVGGNVL